MAARKTTAGSRKTRTRRARTTRRWSAEVTRHSDALDLESRVFTKSPPEIAASLMRSAQRSCRRKAGPYQSAMSMLTFYINRGGRGLSAARRAKLERAKDELRKRHGRSRAKSR
jgi:Protein of unknown function (DUF3175)